MAATLEDLQKKHDSFFEDYEIISTRYNFSRDNTHPGLFTPWNAKTIYKNGEGETMGLIRNIGRTS